MQALSAACTLVMAASRSNGGSGGRVSVRGPGSTLGGLCAKDDQGERRAARSRLGVAVSWRPTTSLRRQWRRRRPAPRDKPGSLPLCLSVAAAVLAALMPGDRDRQREKTRASPDVSSAS